MPSGLGTPFRCEIEALLLCRLRQVWIIVLLPATAFLVKNLIDPNHILFPAPIDLLALALVVLLALALGVLLSKRKHWSLKQLRALELVLFGVLTAYFTWSQFRQITRGNLLEQSAPGLEGLLDLAFVGSGARWFFLIVVYGVFIPNSWRRCALVTGCMAVVPLALTPLVAGWRGQLDGQVLAVLFPVAVLLATAVGVAVFGSSRIYALQEQAFEAQELGQYRLKRKLGAGGMGEVHLAEHLLLRRPCAIKLIRPDQAGDPVNLERFEREVQAMATLTHFNTVEVFDYGHADDGTFYYVMEYLPGQNLEELVARHGSLPPARAVHFLRQVCGALREAHAAGLLHRDIKPSNVLACERGGVHDVAKLLDFGLVQETRLGPGEARLTLQGSIIGSPPFMSPEQAAGSSQVDARSDIYGVGGLAYYLLTGRPPFQRETAMQMLLAHAYEAVVPPRELRPEIPADLEAIVLRCLAKDPAERYPDAQSLEQALAGCSCAGGWDEEKAAAWWREVREPEGTAAHAIAAQETTAAGP
jgi:hypothetical protein